MFEELASYGTLTVKRAYGDWTHAAAQRLEGRAAPARDLADAAVRLHQRQELHRLGADHRRDGPAVRRQRRRLRDRVQRQPTSPGWRPGCASPGRPSTASASARRPRRSRTRATSSRSWRCSASPMPLLQPPPTPQRWRRDGTGRVRAGLQAPPAEHADQGAEQDRVGRRRLVGAREPRQPPEPDRPVVRPAHLRVREAQRPGQGAALRRDPHRGVPRGRASSGCG